MSYLKLRCPNTTANSAGAKLTVLSFRSQAFEKAFKNIPKHLKLSLIYDNGTEMAQHKLFTKNSKVKVYFAHPYSPWERPTNENTNGLIRDYFPKGTDFSLVTKKQLKEVQNEINERPRKVLELINKELMALKT